MAITKSEIFGVADAILEQGGNPTLAAVRKLLGGGSFTTISEAMAEWRENQQAVQAKSNFREPAPETVTMRLNDLGNEIWSIALEIATGRLQAERDALEQARKEYETSMKEAVVLADDLNTELERAQDTIKKQTEIAGFTAVEIEKLKSSISTLTDQLNKANQASGTANAALAESHKHVSYITKQLESEQDARESINRKLEQSLETNSAQKSELARLEAELKAMSQRAEFAESSDKQTSSEMQVLRTNLAVAEEKIRQLTNNPGHVAGKGK